MQNKLQNKYLLPHYIAATLLFIISIMSVAMMPKDSKLGQLVFQNEIRSNSDTKYFVLVVIILVCIAMAGDECIVVPKKVNKKVNQLTKEYLLHVFQKYPELKQYQYVLDDPKKLKEIAAVICNELNIQEQEYILYIVKKAFNKSDNPAKSYIEKQEEIIMAEERILEIIKRHAEIHPKYLQNVLTVLDCNINIMNIKEQKNMVFTKNKGR